MASTAPSCTSSRPCPWVIFHLFLHRQAFPSANEPAQQVPFYQINKLELFSTALFGQDPISLLFLFISQKTCLHPGTPFLYLLLILKLIWVWLQTSLLYRNSSCQSDWKISSPNSDLFFHTYLLKWQVENAVLLKILDYLNFCDSLLL